MTKPIRFLLDASEVEAAPEETIWQVASRRGIEIPHLCWHPAPGYRADLNGFAPPEGDEVPMEF
jgi:formate dehydrogenase major subunit